MGDTVADRRILSPNEAAQEVGCHAKTILRALRTDELTGYQRTQNGSWRIYREDLDAWIRGEQPTKRRKSA